MKAIEENREDPDSVGELVKITQVLESYYVDFMKIMTNTFFLILDIAGIIGVAGATIPIIGWTAALGATALNVGLSLGSVGIELGAEYYSDLHWKEVYDQILNICQEEIDEERKRIATEDIESSSLQIQLPLLYQHRIKTRFFQLLSESFSTSQVSFFPTLLLKL